MLHNMLVLAVGEHFFIISKMNKTGCFKSRHFINIYIINRTLHGRLGIRILSSRAESISHSFASLTRERYLQHTKIKFVSPRGHVISSIYPTSANGIIVLLNSLNSKSLKVRNTSKESEKIRAKSKKLDEVAMLCNWWSDRPRLITETFLTFSRTSKSRN